MQITLTDDERLAVRVAGVYVKEEAYFSAASDDDPYWPLALRQALLSGIEALRTGQTRFVLTYDQMTALASASAEELDGCAMNDPAQWPPRFAEALQQGADKLEAAIARQTVLPSVETAMDCFDARDAQVQAQQKDLI